LGPGPVARLHSLAVPAVFRVGVRSRRPPRGERLRKNAAGDHSPAPRPKWSQRAGRRGLRGDHVAAPNAGHQGAGMPDPIHQFEIHPIIPIKLFGWDVSFTNSSLFMLVAVLLITGFFMLSMRARALVPSRMQSMAEVGYEFVAGMLRDSTGHGGMKYFPLVFTIFMFVFTCNMLGIIPGFFTVTSHIVVTA